MNGLETPEKILSATLTYQTEEDDIGQFIEDFCVVEADAFVSIHEFKKKFKEINTYSKSQKSLSEYMRRRGFLKLDNRVTMPNGEQVRAFTGLRLKNKNSVESWA